MILAVCRRIGRQICEKNEGRDVFEDLQERGEPSLEDGDDLVVPGGLLERGEPSLEDGDDPVVPGGLQERGEPPLDDGDDPAVPGGLLQRGEPPLEDLEALEDAVENAREISVVDETGIVQSSQSVEPVICHEVFYT